MDKAKIQTLLNTVFAGTIIGILIPFLSIYIFYCITPTDKSFGNFVQYSMLLQIFTRVISICAIPNLAAFFLLMNWNYVRAARGIILATFIITFGVLILKGFIE